MRAIDPHVHDKFPPKRIDWQVLCHTKYTSYGFRDRYFTFFHYKSMGMIGPQGVASLDSRGLIGGALLDVVTY